MSDFPVGDITSCWPPKSAGQVAAVLEKSAMQWFALNVKPRFDKAVGRALANKGFETLVPLYKKRYSCGTRLKESELPLFPGYVFCRFDVLKRLPILMTPGVTHILGNGDHPLALLQTEIASLKTAIQAGVRLQSFPYIEVGQKVRIEKGALAGIVGIVVKFKQSLRLVLSVTLLQRSVLVEIDSREVALEPELQRAR
jgi:transcription antitermination factor NusG